VTPLTLTARRDVLAATELFGGLVREDLEALAKLATQRRAVRDETVVRRGDLDCSLMILVHGRLRAGTVSADGREVTLAVMEAGAVLGEIALLDGRERSLDVTAMVESLLLVVERTAFLPFLTARPDLMLRLMALLCDRLRRSSVAFEDVALASLSARLARLLLDIAATHGRPTPDGVRIRQRLSQRELSARVAATRERVNKQLRQWHEQGVLGEAEGDMVLRRPEALRALLA
jgi:CRP/FNR family cyclic AMP-dependent transcriptional regulator